MWVSHLGFAVLLGMLAMCATHAVSQAGECSGDNDDRARQFIQRHETIIRPLGIEVGLRWWDANVSGNKADYQRKQEAETRLDVALSDPRAFAELKAVKQHALRDPLLARQIEILYLQYLPRQVAPELLKQILASSNAAERQFNVYRAHVGGKELSENDVRRVLRQSNDSAERRAAWEASKEVGRAVEADLRQLVKLRNRAAVTLGFQDYHVMQLHLGEQSQQEVLKLFDELDALTRGPFQTAKAEIDAALAKRCGIPVDELRPWHYHDPFFQESPEVFGDSQDAVYAPLDILKVCREFYAGIGLPVDDVLRRSDLYEKKGKNPHAFSTDIDRAGDVRVLANIVPSRRWLSTMLHELGHAVYSSKNIPRSVPYALRTDAHALCTEGVAMMYERFADQAEWLTAMGASVPDPERFNQTARKLRRNQLLIFSRWCQVMFRFERALYANPDQDLNRVWWDLVEKYQELRRPEGRNQPDYAAKIHIVSAPAYYHNYMLGEMFALQVHNALIREVLRSPAAAQAIYVGNPAAGEFMKQRVFAPGQTLNWNQLTRHATGEDLSAKAFAADLKSK